MGILSAIYDKSPVFIQNLMCSTKGWFICKRRYNSSFFDNLSRYLKNDIDKEVCLREFILQTENVLAYEGILTHKEYRELELEKISVYEILKKFPIIDKATIKKNISDYYNPAYKGDKITMHTSGTTGSGLVFPYSVDMENKQWAIWWRYRVRLGLSLDTWCGWFGGRVIISPQNGKSPFWRINKPAKQVMFSLYHMTDKTIASYCDMITKCNLTWVHGYPSSIARLSSLINENGLKPIMCVKVITTGAEGLYDYQISIMKKAFPNAIIRQHYGLAEGVANFSQDLDGNWHIDDDFCCVEFIPLSDDDPTLCKIIGTGFANKAFPLVRYFTGDLANVSWDGGTPILKNIIGRCDDYITLPNGARINSGLDYILKDSTNVKEAQLHQKTLHDYVFNVVKGVNYSQVDEMRIIKKFRERLGNDVNISFNYINEIEKTKAGKFKMFVSDLI